MANTLKFGNGQWATKVGSTLAYNDENGNFKPLPFNFTRSTSATRVNKDGLIEVVTNNKPRIDFLNDSNGALLLEPSRTNLVQYSEDTTEWAKNETPINTSNAAISPDGTQSADNVLVNSISEGFYDFSIGTVNSGTTYTFSIFIKYISGVETIRFGGSGGGFGADNNNVFNIKNGTTITAFSGNTISVDDYGNGWYRLKATKAATSTATAAWFLYGNEDAEIQYSVWGAQVEQGSYATSYIPTQGATATRVGESCDGAGNDQVINSTEGVFYVEISALANDSDSKRITISDGTLANRITISVSDNIVSGFINVNNVTQYTFYESNQNVLSPIKIAVKYKANDFAIWISGVEYDASTSGTTFPPSTLTQLSFDNAVGTNVFYGNVKDLQVFTTALTDAELQALTTI
jgi:hypothetical protein